MINGVGIESTVHPRPWLVFVPLRRRHWWLASIALPHHGQQRITMDRKEN